MQQVLTSRSKQTAIRVVRRHLLALTLVAGTTAFACAEEGRHAVGPDSSYLDKSGDDGPYVFLQSDSAAIILYMRDGVVNRQTVSYLDTLRFSDPGVTAVTNYAVPRTTPEVSAQVFDSVPRILTVSDVHGDFKSLVAILQESGVIDRDHHWIWGTGHLVVLGDVFDRGDKVNDCLWLIYRLEQESQHHGGMVHFVLGNHEVMVLRGDDRYVHETYQSGIVTATGLEYSELYGPNTVMGRWLRSKHAALKINAVLFVHGGIARSWADRGWSLTQINDGIRTGIDEAASALAVDTLRQLLLGKHGPLWYRGYFQEMENAYPQASRDDVEFVLRYYEATTVVVGHTEVEQVSGLHESRIIAIDVPVEELGGLQALLWENGRFNRIRKEGDSEPIE